MISKFYAMMLIFINLGWMMWSEKYQIGPDCFLKCWTFAKWLFDIFKMDQTFIKDPLHRMESLIWSSHKLHAFYSYSNYKLKIYGSVRKKYHIKPVCWWNSWNFKWILLLWNNFSTHHSIYDFPYWPIYSGHIICQLYIFISGLQKFGPFSQNWYTIRT